MHSKIILGTVQFGLRYGINNQSGKPTQKEVFGILDTAAENRIESLDTADVYGDATELIGLYHRQKQVQRFKILGKFKGSGLKRLYDHVLNSLDKLHIPNFEVYSYHSIDDYWNYPSLKEDLLALKEKKVIRKIGISAYTNSELESVLTDEIIDIIQLPFNLLDNDNLRGELLDKLVKNGKEIHTRSVFLQGLFFTPEELIPSKLIPLKGYLNDIRLFCQKENIDMHSLALSYALYNQRIHRVLIGIDNKEQLMYNLRAIAELKYAFDYINQHIFVKEKKLLNPVNWK